LFKLSQDDQSTEAGSDFTSDSENEENKMSDPSVGQISIVESDRLSDLSAVIRAKPFVGDHELLPLPQPEYMKMNNNMPADSFEKIQRQRILALMMENTMMLNNIISGQDTFEKKIKTSINELKSFKYFLKKMFKNILDSNSVKAPNPRSKKLNKSRNKRKFLDNLIPTQPQVPCSSTSSMDPTFTDMSSLWKAKSPPLFSEREI
jgi:hypothetical protein